MSPGPRPTSMLSGILIRPTIWSQYTKRYRQIGQRSRTIGWTVACNGHPKTDIQPACYCQKIAVIMLDCSSRAKKMRFDCWLLVHKTTLTLDVVCFIVADKPKKVTSDGALNSTGDSPACQTDVMSTSRKCHMLLTWHWSTECRKAVIYWNCAYQVCKCSHSCIVGIY